MVFDTRAMAAEYTIGTQLYDIHKTWTLSCLNCFTTLFAEKCLCIITTQYSDHICDVDDDSEYLVVSIK